MNVCRTVFPQSSTDKLSFRPRVYAGAVSKTVITAPVRGAHTVTAVLIRSTVQIPMGQCNRYRVAPDAMRGSYSGGHASLATWPARIIQTAKGRYNFPRGPARTLVFPRCANPRQIRFIGCHRLPESPRFAQVAPGRDKLGYVSAPGDVSCLRFAPIMVNSAAHSRARGGSPIPKWPQGLSIHQ